MRNKPWVEQYVSDEEERGMWLIFHLLGSRGSLRNWERLDCLTYLGVHEDSCQLAWNTVLLSSFSWSILLLRKNLKKILTWADCGRNHTVPCNIKIPSVLCHWHIQAPSGISQASMFKVLYKVTAALVRQLIKYVNFPYNQQSWQQIKERFYDISRFSSVPRMMACAHII